MHQNSKHLNFGSDFCGFYFLKANLMKLKKINEIQTILKIEGKKKEIKIKTFLEEIFVFCSSFRDSILLQDFHFLFHVRNTFIL